MKRFLIGFLVAVLFLSFLRPPYRFLAETPGTLSSGDEVSTSEDERLLQVRLDALTAFEEFLQAYKYRDYTFDNEALKGLLAFEDEIGWSNYTNTDRTFTHFYLADITGDGVEEMMLDAHNSLPMLANGDPVLYYDAEQAEVKGLGVSGNYAIYLEDGYFLQTARHNQGNPPSYVWPFLALKFDETSKDFVKIASVSSSDDPDWDFHYYFDDGSGQRRLETAEMESYLDEWRIKGLRSDSNWYKKYPIFTQGIQKSMGSYLLRDYHIDMSSYPHVRIYIPQNLLSSSAAFTINSENRGLYYSQREIEPEILRNTSIIFGDNLGDFSSLSHGLSNELKVLLEMNPTWRIQLGTTYGSYMIEQDYTSDFQALNAALAGIVVGEEANVIDAIYMELLRMAGQPGLNNLVVITGRDIPYSSDQVDLPMLRDLVTDIGIPIYVLVPSGEVRENGYETLIRGGLPFTNFADIVSASDGEIMMSTIGNISDIFEKLRTELMNYRGIEINLEEHGSTPDQLLFGLDERGTSYMPPGVPFEVPVDVRDHGYHNLQANEFSEQDISEIQDRTSQEDQVAASVEYYLNAFVEAMNLRNYDPLIPIVIPGSSMEEIQSQFVLNEYDEELISYQITGLDFLDDYNCVVRTREIYSMSTLKDPLHTLIQQCSYHLIFHDGIWKFDHFTENVYVEQRIF